MATLFSHSRLSSFENCPKQFHFRYVLKLPQETEGIEAFVGKRVHEILERLYVFVDQGRVPSLDKVLARYRAFWEEQFVEERIRVVREDTTVDDYRKLGERCLQSYYRRHYPFDEGETLGLEQRVTFPLDDDGAYQMQGIVDRVSRAADGTIEIHDYKTGKWVPTQKKLDEDRQLALYQIGLARDLGESEHYRLVWHYLARGQIRTSTRSEEQLADLRRNVIDLIDRIGAETEFAPRETPLCAWCEYRSLCPLWNGAESQPEPAATAETAAAPVGGSTSDAAGPAKSPIPPSGQLDLL